MKKFLSMALALVMTLSLCAVVTAPKADAGFADESELSSKYAIQAADVIQTIEVMDGYDDGTFRPTAGLTRQAAAKIICNMILGPTTARALPTNANPFPDVIAGNQFSGYISYCSQQGIISGYSDGTFRPGDPLSGYAYLKMLLGALGYDAKHEGFVGDNWKVNVAKIALGIELNKGIEEDLDGTTQVTREAAAIYAFNTLQADMVEYDSKNTIEINGVTVSMGGGNAVPQTWSTSATQANHISAAQDNGRPIVQFAERYFDKLERFPNGSITPTNATLGNGRDLYNPDDFGRPSIRWDWKGVEIGTYSRDPDATFVGNVKVNEIYDALGMSSGDDNAHLFINSNEPNNVNLEVKRGNDKDLDHGSNLNIDRSGTAATNPNYGWSNGPDAPHYVDRIGDGTLIECFLNEANNHVDVCVISVYGGKVDAVKGATAKKDAYVTLNVAPPASMARPENIWGNSERREYETEDYDVDDVVAYTYSDSANSIKSMYLLSAESGALQSKVIGKSLRLDSTTYSYGKEYTFDDIQNDEQGLSNKSSYVVYLDENDYVLWVEEDEFVVDDFVLVESITVETGTETVTSSLAQNIAYNEFLKGNGANPFPTANETLYQQIRAAANTSSEAKAQVRYSSGSRRTITLDDSKNYRTDAAGAGADKNNLTNVSGDGNGLWIATPFAAGRIVRLSSNSDGYRLHPISATRYNEVTNFSISGNRMRQNGSPLNITADSETHFVVDDLENGTYKSYYGIKNVPSVALQGATLTNGAANPHSGDNAIAYIYYNGNTAKLVYVTHAWGVSSSSNDIVFLVANSTSNLVQSDDGDYYEVNAVDKNEIKTLMVKAGTSFTLNGSTTEVFKPGVGSTEKEDHCVILNNVTYDTNDFITKGSFDIDDDIPNKAQGIRRVNAEEVRLDTVTGGSNILRDVSESVRVFFVDGDDIEQIDYSEIDNDTLDYVYYIEDDESEITYLFIVDYEPDTTAPVVAPTTYTVYSTPVDASNAAAPYTLTFVDGYSSLNTAGDAVVTAGSTLRFQIQDGASALKSSSDVAVSVRYTAIAGSTTYTNVTNTVISSSATLWSMTIPTDIASGSPISIQVV